MTPREQLRKMTTLGEQGALDEKHWYRLVNGMSAGGETQAAARDQPTTEAAQQTRTLEAETSF